MEGDISADTGDASYAYNTTGGPTYNNYAQEDPFGHVNANDPLVEPNETYKSYDRNYDNYQETNIDEIINDNDVTDNAIMATMGTIANNFMSDPEKPHGNGNGPIGEYQIATDKINDDTGDTGCGTDCMYYALLCCECSIL